MPAPKFEWRTYEIHVPADSPLRALTLTPSPFALRRAAPDTMTIRLPDLAAWPSPLDKAEILLESAAEIEHALIVQYLYAAYSLKSSERGHRPRTTGGAGRPCMARRPVRDCP